MPGLNLRMLEKRFAATEERERIIEAKYNSKSRFNKRRMEDADIDNDPEGDLRSAMAPLGDIRKGCRATSQVVASSGSARAALQKQYVHSTNTMRGKLKEVVEDQKRRIEEIKKEAAADRAYQEQKQSDRHYKGTLGGKVCYDDEGHPPRPSSAARLATKLAAANQQNAESFFERANRMASDEGKVNDGDGNPSSRQESDSRNDRFAGLFDGISALSQVPLVTASAPPVAASKNSSQVPYAATRSSVSAATADSAFAGSYETLPNESRDTEAGMPIPMQRIDNEDDALAQTQTPTAIAGRSNIQSREFGAGSSSSSSPTGPLSPNAVWRVKAPSPFLANEKGKRPSDPHNSLRPPASYGAIAPSPSVRTENTFLSRTPSSTATHQQQDTRNASLATNAPKPEPLFLTAVQRSLLQQGGGGTQRGHATFVNGADGNNGHARPATASSITSGGGGIVGVASSLRPATSSVHNRHASATTLSATAALSAARYRNPKPILIPNRPWTAGTTNGRRPMRHLAEQPHQEAGSSEDDADPNADYNTEGNASAPKSSVAKAKVIKGNFQSHYKSPAAALAALRHILAPGIGIPPPPRVPPKFYPRQVSRSSSPTDPPVEPMPYKANLYDQSSTEAGGSVPSTGLNAHFAQLTNCPAAATLKDFYYIHIRVQHQSSLSDWLFTVVITDVTPVTVEAETLFEGLADGQRGGIPDVIPPATTQTNLLLLNGVHTNTSSYDGGAGLGCIGVGVGNGGRTTTSSAAASESSNIRSAAAGVSMVQTRPLSGAGRPPGVSMMTSRHAAAATPMGLDPTTTDSPNAVVNIYRHTISGVRVNEHKYLVFHPPTGTTLSPVEDIPWVPCPSYLFGRSLRIEVFATRPSRTKVVDTVVSFGEE